MTSSLYEHYAIESMHILIQRHHHSPPLVYIQVHLYKGIMHYKKIYLIHFGSLDYQAFRQINLLDNVSQSLSQSIHIVLVEVGGRFIQG